jgi:opacity protein-like surface antigen
MIGRQRSLAVLLAVPFTVTLGVLAVPAVADAQPRDEPVRIAVYGTAGVFTATAKDSFSAILDKESGTDIGAGAQIALQTGMLRGLFVQVDASRFEETGERVFVHDREVFPLGIPLTIGLTPIEVSAGYRFNPARRVRGATVRSRFAVFAGGGVGSVGYKELDDADAFNERFTAYHVMGGADVTVWKMIQVGAEVRYRTVPDSLGVGGVSDEFNESDLGGTTIRVRFGVAF